MIVALLVAPAFAGEPSPLRIGLSAAVSADLPAVDPLPATQFGPGGTAVVPIWWRFAPGAFLRAHVEVGFAGGQDRVVWVQDVGGTPVGVYSDAHGAGYVAGRLLVGPEAELLPARLVRPYLGAAAGFGVVANWQRFDAEAASLGTESASTTQGVGAAGADVGVRVGRVGGVAVEVELGYTVSFLPEASLQQALPELEAARSPYVLDVVRGGIGVSIPL